MFLYISAWKSMQQCPTQHFLVPTRESPGVMDRLQLLGLPVQETVKELGWQEVGLHQSRVSSPRQSPCYPIRHHSQDTKSEIIANKNEIIDNLRTMPAPGWWRKLLNTNSCVYMLVISPWCILCNAIILKLLLTISMEPKCWQRENGSTFIKQRDVEKGRLLF